MGLLKSVALFGRPVSEGTVSGVYMTEKEQAGEDGYTFRRDDGLPEPMPTRDVLSRGSIPLP